MAAIELALGPCFFNWSAESFTDFYARIADEAAVERVYLGEVVCGKRMAFFNKVWPEAIERLTKAGKTVVLSTLALPAKGPERRVVGELAEQGALIEINDLSALLARAGRPFVAGPFLNIYNESSLAHLAARGAMDWCPPVELPLSSIETAAAANSGVTVELFAFGRLPLAVSGRCYHARAHGLSKDSCQFVCDQDPDGMEVETLEGDRFLAVNGIQTLSSGCQLVTLAAADLSQSGIGRLRLSPHTLDMVEVAGHYRAMLDGVHSAEETTARLREMPLPGTACNGYLAGEAGWREVAL
ncbi:U32 family peptidase [Pelagibius litoralis]|uniref:Ubiquinone biosynthesis protein UbiV n=1 Tax=Pelagibius litoralis TaxID=374515 RepID=A0A967F1G1_9PROT|nr:U32 family peptidase [Pelagibius litoralis]NIA71284.1 U32 family peptidase [Pelagibius litoralis]